MSTKIPDKLLLRRGEVMDLLGVCNSTINKMIENGNLTPVYPAGKKRAFFRRTEIEQLTGTKESVDDDR